MAGGALNHKKTASVPATIAQKAARSTCPLIKAITPYITKSGAKTPPERPSIPSTTPEEKVATITIINIGI